MQVTVLYVRNLSLTTTEQNLRNQFNSVSGGDVTKVKMMRDFAFIHFASRSSAENAMKTLNSKYWNLNSLYIEINSCFFTRYNIQWNAHWGCLGKTCQREAQRGQKENLTEQSESTGEQHPGKKLVLFANDANVFVVDSVLSSSTTEQVIKIFVSLLLWIIICLLYESNYICCFSCSSQGHFLSHRRQSKFQEWIFHQFKHSILRQLRALSTFHELDTM